MDRTLLKTNFGEELLSSDDEFAACISDGSLPDYSQDFGWPAWTAENCEFSLFRNLHIHKVEELLILAFQFLVFQQ